MSRRIDLLDDELRLRYSGLSAWAVCARELRVPYAAMRSVTVGLAELPGTFALKLGTNTAPFGETRRGTFWTGGRRVFYDVNDRERAVVVDLEGHRFARLALGADDPEALAEQLRAGSRLRP